MPTVAVQRCRNVQKKKETKQNKTSEWSPFKKYWLNRKSHLCASLNVGRRKEFCVSSVSRSIDPSSLSLSLLPFFFIYFFLPSLAQNWVAGIGRLTHTGLLSQPRSICDPRSDVASTTAFILLATPRYFFHCRAAFSNNKKCANEQLNTRKHSYRFCIDPGKACDMHRISLGFQYHYFAIQKEIRRVFFFLLIPYWCGCIINNK